jgi:hypothetical protein
MGKLARAIDQAAALALMLLGVVHDLVGFADFQELTPRWLWFMGSGLALFGIGALNLARRWTAHAGVALLSFSTNILLLTFTVAAAAVFYAEQPVTAIALTALAGLLTLFSFRAAFVRLK